MRSGGASRGAQVAGALAVAALTVVLVSGSQVSLRPPDAGTALLRLAWSVRPERIETCRAREASELQGVPAHMRQALLCDGRPATYRLEVRRAGVPVFSRVLSGGGLRHDRPVYVFEELPLPTGASDVVVRFDRVEPDPPVEALDATGRDTSHERARLEAAPSRLELHQAVTVTAGQVVLVTYESDRRVLVTRP